jgi:DNA-binding MarR family transcriptional regulator
MLDIPAVVRPFALLTDRELTVREVAILGVIAQNPGHSTKHIASTLRLTKPAVTRATTKLDKHGLITRATYDGDKRMRTLVATAAGRKLLQQIEVQ